MREPAPPDGGAETTEMAGVQRVSESPLHPRPKGWCIRDSLRSRSIKNILVFFAIPILIVYIFYTF